MRGWRAFLAIKNAQTILGITAGTVNKLEALEIWADLKGRCNEPRRWALKKFIKNTGDKFGAMNAAGVFPAVSFNIMII